MSLWERYRREFKEAKGHVGLEREAVARFMEAQRR